MAVLAEAVLRLVSRVGRDTGCLMVIEDLHDCDAETLAVVEYLADDLAGQRTMVLATARTDPGKALDLIRAAAQRDSGTYRSALVSGKGRWNAPYHSRGAQRPAPAADAA